MKNWSNCYNWTQLIVSTAFFKSCVFFFSSSMLGWLGESMAMSGIYGLRNSLSESNSSLSNSSINGSCMGTFAGTTSNGSSPDDSSLQLSASLTSNPFSHLTSVSLSSSGSMNTPIKNFDNLQVSQLYHMHLCCAIDCVLAHLNSSGHEPSMDVCFGVIWIFVCACAVIECVCKCQHCCFIRSIETHFEG